MSVLKCKVCTTYLGEIRKEARKRNIRGNVLDGILNYTDGVKYIQKGNFDKHIKSGSLHSWAKSAYANAATGSTTEEPQVFLGRNQATINDTIESSARGNYKKLVRTALHITLKEKPYSDFPHLTDLQKSNGLKFLQGKTHRKTCAEPIECLADVLRSDLKEILHNANFYSSLFDGSQPKKTYSEKELLYVKVLIRGKAVDLLCKCIHMDDYGSDAIDLKHAFDDPLKEDYKLEDCFIPLLITHCADGASVNMGRYNGAWTQIKADGRPWLLVIHCENHRLELAIADVYKMELNLKDVDIFLLQVYQLFKNSGRLKRLLHTIALNLNVTTVSFVKSHGTRFQNHKYRAIKALIINLVPFYLLCENALDGGREVCRLPTTLATLQGFFEKLQSYKYVAGMHFYHKTTRITAHLSFTMQKQTGLVIDVIDSIKEGLEKLEETAPDAKELPFPVIPNEEDTSVIEAKSTNLPATQTFREHNQLTEKQKAKAMKFVAINKESITIKNFHQVSIFTFVVISFKTNTICINLILGFKKFTCEFVCICACLCSV